MKHIKESGNTPKQSRSWLITLPADKNDQAEVETKLGNYTYTGQLEKSESGYLHWQIYVENTTPIAFNTLKKKFPTGHFEQRKGSKQQAFDYVNKNQTAAGVKISNGSIDLSSACGGRSDLQLYREKILYSGYRPEQVLLEFPGALRYKRFLEDLFNAHAFEVARTELRLDLEVSYIWGPTGSGKTSSIFKKYPIGDFFRVSNYQHPFDSYRGEPVLVLDEFRGQLPFSLLLNLLDIYPLELPARYGNRIAAYRRVYLISNVELDSLYPEIQVREPNSWAALKRRISSLQFMGNTPTNQLNQNKLSEVKK